METNSNIIVVVIIIIIYLLVSLFTITVIYFFICLLLILLLILILHYCYYYYYYLLSLLLLITINYDDSLYWSCLCAKNGRQGQGLYQTRSPRPPRTSSTNLRMVVVENGLDSRTGCDRDNT